MSIGYIRYTSGLTLYVKPLPLTNSPWTTGVITGVENGTLGSYSFSGLTSSVEYEVFLRAGGTATSTDLAIGSISFASTGGGTGDATLANQLAIISTLSGIVLPVPTPTTSPPSQQVDYYNGEANIAKVIPTANYTAITIELAIELRDKTDIVVIPDGSLTKTNTSVSFIIPSQVYTLVRSYKYSLRQTSDKKILVVGNITGYYAPLTP